MSATFTRVNAIMPGDKITSAQRNNLADGQNSRMRSGIGDITRRLWFKAIALMRTIQNPESAIRYAAQDVWFSHYCHVPFGGDTWPPLPMGDEGGFSGVNLENPLMAYIYGSTAYNIESEQRLNIIEAPESGVDAVTAWQYGKAQRGGVILTSGQEAAPVLNAARSHLLITPGNWPFLVTYGGHRLNVDGEARLAFGVGDQIEEVMARYVADFRGTTAQRAELETYRIRASAFYSQGFYSRQYLLAPALAEDAGGGQIDYEFGYPVFEMDGASPGPNFPNAELTAGGDIKEIPAGYVLAGWRVRGTNVPEAIDLRVIDYDEGYTVEECTVPAGNSESVEWLDHSHIEGPVRIAVNNWGALVTAGAGQIEIEFAILEARKPTLLDAYVVLRRASTDGEMGFDRRGEDTPNQPDITTEYFRVGCIVGHQIPAQDSPNENPVHEAARRLLRDRMRLLRRESLQGYAVENGKTVLWFARNVNVGGTLFDVWDGIAPPLEAVTEIQAGLEYAVTVAAVNYNGTEVSPGSTFTGVIGVESFSGTGEVRQVNGIVVTAPPRGHTNEWLMHFTTHVYSTSESSAYKPENYGDISTLQHDRCHFLSAGMIANTSVRIDIFNHIAAGNTPNQPPLVTAGMPAHRYVDNLNAVGRLNATDDERDSFYRACPLYPPDYEIESATMDVGEVKLTFTTRFRNTGEVAGDIARYTVPGAEAYRTDENALRQYLYAQPCARQIGDIAELQNLSEEGANGSCHPRFHFSKLMEEVPEDTPPNETQDRATDTRMFSEQITWSQFVLGSACEGFVDLEIGLGTNPCNGRPSNYRFSTLCAQIDPAMTAFQMFDPSVNPAKGYGPMPATKLYSKLFNNLAIGWNLLTTVPVELPVVVRVKTQQRYRLATQSMSVVQPSGSPSCPQGFGPTPLHLFFNGVPEWEGAVAYATEADWRYTNTISNQRTAAGTNQNLNIPTLNSGRTAYAGIYGGETAFGTTRAFYDCAGQNYQTLVHEQNDAAQIRLSTIPVLDNLTGLVGDLSMILVVESNRSWFEQDNSAAVLACGGTNWPGNALRLNFRSETTLSCENGQVLGEDYEDFDLSVLPDFHTGYLTWMQPLTSSFGPACSVGPSVSTVITAQSAIGTATVPLV